MTVFIFIAIALIIAIMLVVSMVNQKDMSLISKIEIDRPKDIVLNYISQLRNQEQYNTWQMSDPNIIMDYRGTDGTPGFIAAWISKTRMGNGEQEILAVSPDGIDSELRFANHDNTTHVRTSVHVVNDTSSTATMIMTFRPSFPMNIMMPLIKNMMQKGMDQTLSNLKRKLESGS